jgi:hypothetical protein
MMPVAPGTVRVPPRKYPPPPAVVVLNGTLNPAGCKLSVGALVVVLK